MKNWILGTAAMLAATAVAGAACAGDVTVRVHGVQGRPGTLYLAMQTRDQFMKPAMAAGDYKEDPQAGTQTFVLRNVPAGDYAISALHDENGDRQMNLAPDGRPMEGWAVTRFTGHHKPSFEEADVTIPADGATLDLTMTYPH
jgi:uncharacterized protein (DUF2141 family)